MTAERKAKLKEILMDLLFDIIAAFFMPREYTASPRRRSSPRAAYPA